MQACLQALFHKQSLCVNQLLFVALQNVEYSNGIVCVCVCV